MDINACKKGQVRIDGKCKSHSIFGNIAGLHNITTKHHTKGSDTYNIDIGNNVNIEIWQGPSDFGTRKRTMYFEDVHVKEKLSPSQLKNLNQIARAMKKTGIIHAKDNFISVSPKRIITKEKHKGDDVIYTYHGSMNYMPQKKGVKSGWTGYIEFDVFKPTKSGEYGSETIDLDLTSSVLEEIKETGYDLSSEKGHDKFMEDASMNYNWTQKLLRLAREDFAEARRK